MGKLLNSLQLQTFLILWIIYAVNGAPYSKYGRTCKDIGCLPRETCTMAYDTCSFNQQEGTNCGRYPTCSKRQDVQPPQQNSGPSPTRPTTSNTNIWNLPTTTTTRYTTTTTTRPTTTTTTTRRQWTTKSPFYSPSNPSYGGGGNYFGNRYGDDDPFGSFSRTTSTRRPSSGSSDSFGGFLSGLSSLLSGDVGKLISGALSNRGGSSGSTTSGGGFFDTRPLIENKNYRGGLFSENTGSQSQNTQRNQGNTYGGYPVSYDNNQNFAQQPTPSTANPSLSHGNVGWKLS